MYVKDCTPMDSSVVEGDTIIVKEYWDQKKSILCKIQINDSMVESIVAKAWLNEYIRIKIIDKQEKIFGLLIGPKKRHPVTKNSCYAVFTKELVEENAMEESMEETMEESVEEIMEEIM
jgi:hypothetical protein